MSKTVSDDGLMAELRGGSGEALDALMARHRESVVRLAHRAVGDRGRAEDVAQETFLRVLQHASTYQGIGQFVPWLRTIAERLSSNARRWGRRHPEQPLEAAWGRAAPSSADRALRAREVNEALDRLPPRQRLALILKAVEGRSYREISQILHCSESDVANAVFRARKALSRTLG